MNLASFLCGNIKLVVDSFDFSKQQITEMTGFFQSARLTERQKFRILYNCDKDKLQSAGGLFSAVF